MEWILKFRRKVGFIFNYKDRIFNDLVHIDAVVRFHSSIYFWETFNLTNSSTFTIASYIKTTKGHVEMTGSEPALNIFLRKMHHTVVVQGAAKISSDGRTVSSSSSTSSSICPPKYNRTTISGDVIGTDTCSYR